MRQPRRQWPLEQTCTAEPSCGNKRHGGSALCQKHRWAVKQGPACSVAGCARVAVARGWCNPHYYRWNRTGDVRAVELLRDHAAYGTGKSAKDGYVLCYRPSHPDAQKRGYIYEHRLVMEQMLGRRLLPEETPHHRNGNRGDNRPENLELWVSSQPKGQRAEDILAWAREVVARYGVPGGLPSL